MVGQLIAAFSIRIGFFAIYVFVYFYFKGVSFYRKETLRTIITKSDEIVMNMKVVDGNLLPYYIVHGYDVAHKFNCSNTKDLITGVSAKKHYCIVTEKVLYICNNQMNYKFDIVDKYDRKFIKLNDDIKNIEILLSFATPEHLLYKMTITKDSEGKYNVNVKNGDVPHD